MNLLAALETINLLMMGGSDADAGRDSNKLTNKTVMVQEFEESEKMDEDSKIIEELRERNECQKAQRAHLEKAFNQAIASQEKVRMSGYNELQIANCMNIIDSKNVELLNLQTALGQYFAEI